MARLGEEILPQLADREISLPDYQRNRVGVGIVHLGIGAFHRAHQALYTEDVLNRFGGDWGICGVSLRRPVVRDKLLPQQGLYTAVTRDGRHSELQIVGALRELLVAPENPAAVIARIADPAVKVVTLTVTEKGYCLDGHGEVDAEHPDIVHDLEHTQAPRSAVGYLCAGLCARMRAAAGPLTVISCDNLAANGNKLRSAVMALARGMEPALVPWIEARCAFPETMVDRIVPATSDELLSEVEQVLGCRDEGVVAGEPFRQWVIARDFAGPVPPWDEVGAQFVDAVAPFEAMKLRLLNASHSSIAYLACLAGWETVSDAVAQPGMEHLIRHMMRVEITPGLDIPADFDVWHYQDQLMRRFANTALQHQTRQVAMDGSQKLPQRLLPAVSWQLAQGGTIAVLSLGIAAWVRYTREPDLIDPLAGKIAAIHQAAGQRVERYLPAMLSLEEVFPRELRDNLVFEEALAAHLHALECDGAAAVIARLAVKLG